MRVRRRRGFLALASVLAALFGLSPIDAAQARARAQPAPDPVIVVAGTGAAEPAIPALDLTLLVDRLAADGYTAFVFYLPGQGLGDIGTTSAAFAPFVDQVLATTGASRVDVVGHSQGGLVARYYIKFLGGEPKVDSFVGLATPHQGTALANLASLHGLVDCVGYTFCQQVVTGSSWLAALNGDDDTFGAVRYTNFATTLDLIVVPYTNSFQRSPGAVNVVVQQRCPLHVVEHLTLALDGTTYSGVQDALAGRPVTLNCLAL